MRVLCRDKKCAVEIEYAELDGKQLVFVTSADVCYRTDDYYHENIAYSALSNLVVDGYIMVEKLYLKEDF